MNEKESKREVICEDKNTEEVFSFSPKTRNILKNIISTGVMILAVSIIIMIGAGIVKGVGEFKKTNESSESQGNDELTVELKNTLIVCVYVALAIPVMIVEKKKDK